MTTRVLTVPAYPVEVSAQLDRHLSRWLWLVKWLLVIPHLLVLAALWAGFVVLTLVALIAIVVTGRYPRQIFEYNVGVLRWTWRVAYYSYGALGTDAYPPFTLAERPDYPAQLHVDYPLQLSRGLVLVKWWLLALPHYLIVGLFVGGGAWAVDSADGSWRGGSLVGLLVAFAGVALLVTGVYPRSIFDFVLGMNRWALRVAAYAALMTDRYPPFRLDLGGDDPGGVALSPPPSAPATPSGKPRWTGRRTVAVVLGSITCLVGLALSLGGGGLLVVDRVARDDTGYINSGNERYRSTTPVLVTDLNLPVEGPSWFYATEQLGRVALTVGPVADRPVFVGIGPRDEVLSWLSGTSFDEVTDLGPDPTYSRATGAGTAPDPSVETFWVARTSGADEQRITWRSRQGEWAVVVMNTSGGGRVEVTATAGATFPHLGDIGAILLGAGLLVLAAGTSAVVLAVPRR